MILVSLLLNGNSTLSQVVAFRFDTLLIPGEVLSPLLAGGHLTRPWVVPSRSPIGSLLGTAFDAAKANLPLLSLELGDAVLHNLCGLVALACGASEEGQSNGRKAARAARLEQAKRYIERHLTEENTAQAASMSFASAISVSMNTRTRRLDNTHYHPSVS